MTDSQEQCPPVRQVAEEYASIRAMREAKDAESKELKKREDELKLKLIQMMSDGGMPSVRFEGLGRFVIKPASNFEIVDIEKFCRAMMQRMVDNANAQRPWSDGLMLQKRPAKGVIEELLEADDIKEAAFPDMGLSRLERLDLTFSKK